MFLHLCFATAKTYFTSARRDITARSERRN